MKKSILKKVFTVVVTMVMLVMFSQPMVEAATVSFISEVVIAYGESDDEAKQKLKDAGYKVFPKNLNVSAEKIVFDGPCVYLGYKTSSNVEDAITDFAVMDMNGGYKIGNYQEELKKSFDEYKTMANDYRIAAAEFKANYEAGSIMAKAAYEQMNFYIDDDTQMLLGDFIMNIPSDDALATVLMQGNLKIVENLSALLAMGVAGTDDDTLVSRIEKNAQNPDQFNDYSYYDEAEMIAAKFEVLSDKLKEYELALGTDGFETDDMYINYANTAMVYETLRNISYKNTTLLDFVMAKTWRIEDFYPIVAAMTEGQKALARLGYSGNLFIYNSTEKTAEEFETLLEQQKQKYPEAMSVYFGIDRSIFKGDFAFTTDALRSQADTGESFWSDFLSSKSGKISLVVFGIGTAATVYSIFQFTKWSKFSQEYAAAKNAYIASDSISYTKKTSGIWVDYATDHVSSAEYAKRTDNFNRVSKIATGYKVAIGVGMILIAISAGCTIWNYYHPDYKEIPDALVDVIETDHGNRYVKYDAVMNIEQQEKKLEDGTTEKESVPADLNGFYGKQWNALYVTKDFTAGRPLLANSIKYNNDNINVAKGYSPVHYFGEDELYNLNSHQFGETKPVYLSFKKSNAKKAAEKEVPDVIATNISYGIAALTGGVGLVAGMGIMELVHRRKKKGAETVK